MTRPSHARLVRLAAGVVLLALAAATAAWLLLRSAQQPPPRRSPPSAPVIVAPAQFASARTRVEAVGTALAVRSVMLYPAAAGEVRQVLFAAGDRVERGAPLLRLEARREQLAVEQAKVDLRTAQQLLQRYERTRGTGAVPENLIDQGRTAVDAARIALRRAEVDLADRTLRAPFDGHVGFTDVDAGDRVEPTTAIAPFDDRSELHVDFDVAEAHLGRLNVGDAIRAQPWNGGAPVDGVVDRIGTRIDAEQRSFRVRARLANTDDALRPGSSVRVTIVLPGPRHAELPEAAIVWGGDGSYLWKVEAGKAVAVPAVIVERRAGRVLVDAAIAEHDPIVVEGVQRLREGMAVRIEADRPPAAVPAAAASAPRRSAWP